MVCQDLLPLLLLVTCADFHSEIQDLRCLDIVLLLGCLSDARGIHLGMNQFTTFSLECLLTLYAYSR
jgi:hypothetical protein